MVYAMTPRGMRKPERRMSMPAAAFTDGAAAEEEHRRDDDVRQDAEEKNTLCAALPQRTLIISHTVCALERCA